jgi:beta-galactosidase GanA
VLVAASVGLLCAWALSSIPGPRADVAWGVTYSPRYAQSLGLDPRATFVDVLDELGVRRVRLPLYWDEVEPTPGAYDLSALDWYLDQARSRGVDVVLVVGYKQPRWPECYAPPWAADLPTDRLRERILALVEAEVAHARAYPNVAMWQVENEPFRGYGECRGPELLTSAFLTEEIGLVRRLDGRPVLVTDSGELSSWIPAMRLPGEYFGTTAYRQ